MVEQKTINSFELTKSRQDALFWLTETGVRKTQAHAVLEVFIRCVEQGATDEEVASVLGIARTSVIARRHDLMRRFPDLFYVVGKRLAPSGVLVDVWMCK